MIAADAFRVIRPLVDHVEHDLTVRGLTSMSLAQGGPVGREIGWPWVAGSTRPPEDLVPLTAAALLSGRWPRLTAAFRPGASVTRGDALQVLAAARLASGRVTVDGAVRVLASAGSEGHEVRRADVQTLQRTLEPGADVALLDVRVAGEPPMALLVTPIDEEAHHRLAATQDTPPALETPAAWGSILDQGRRLRALHGAWEPPHLNEILTTGGAFEGEEAAMNEDVETALRAVLWNPVLSPDASTCGACLLAAGDDPAGNALAGEVARVALAVLSRRMASAWKPRSASHLDAWLWGAEGGGVLEAGLRQLARQAGWSAPGLRTARPPEGLAPSVPSTESRRIERLAHARRLLPGEDRPWWVDDAVHWRMERTLISVFATPDQQAMPLIELAEDGPERAAVARAGRALLGEAEAWLVRDLPWRLTQLLSLPGIGEGTLALLRPLPGRALDAAMKPDRTAEANEAADRLSSGLDSLSSLFGAESS